MLNKPKKGMAQMWWIIATAIIAILVVVFILIWFKGSGGAANDVVKNQISSFSDCDDDGTADFLDDCKCDDKIQKLEKGKECPESTKCPESSEDREKKCKEFHNG
jgi:hypothetical protein